MYNRERGYLADAYRTGDDKLIEEAEKRWEAF
jgi:hypothetical protein